MDPDANLKEQLEIVQAINKAKDKYDSDSVFWSAADEDEWNEQQAERGTRLAELVEALDEWVRKGGFLPKPWHDVQVGKVLT